MQSEITISISPSDENNLEALRKKAVRELFKQYGKIAPEKINITVIKKSIDARHKPVKFVLRCKVDIAATETEHTSQPLAQSNIACDFSFSPNWKHADSKHSVIIVGAGPAGLFAALGLLEYGIKPIIIERGSPTSERRRDIAAISTQGAVDIDSNYCFGEGGAGMFSDGKLFTRSTKRGNVSHILETFVHFGGSPSILTDAHPHIGTDKLPKVVDALCAKITECGGEIFYNTRCVDFLCEKTDGENTPRVTGIVTENTRTNDKRNFLADAVILATGHSATDIYKLVARVAPAALEAKTFAVGVRVEHSRSVIDTIQFHGQNLHGDLPSAEYKLTAQIGGRGVYSFCMCPGGFIVPSSTAPKEIVINGMSTARRNSRWSNAAIVTEIRPEDVPQKFIVQAKNDGCDALASLYFRTALERNTFTEAQKSGALTNSQQAPAQRLVDFLSHTQSTSFPDTSYAPGIISSRIDEWLHPHINKRLQSAFRVFDKKMRGFICDDALIIASETRTSTPVRIVRDKETLECVALRGLYPCGEGSGYAGGITSSAMDGARVAKSVYEAIV